MLALLNQPFWNALWQATGGWDSSRASWLLTLPVFALVVVWLSLELVTWGRAAKPVLCALLVSSAALAYFMKRYGIAFDRGMLSNILETDAAEALELLNPGMFVWVIGLGFLPALAVAMWPRLPRGIRGTLLDKGLLIAGLLALGLLMLIFHSAAYTSLFRNHRELRLQIVPTNLLSALHSKAKANLTPKRQMVMKTLNAVRLPGAQNPGRPMVVVVVVGETMRAANLSVNGYDRPTTPALAARDDVINFGRARSCGTATAVSLPCMFLDVGRESYADGMAYSRESFLDVLQQSGMDVWWLSNNSGCKGVCDRVQFVDATKAAPAGSCGEDGCYDQVLLDSLKQKLVDLRRDTVIVLHMKGQHGPAYYRRYPVAFERFGPVCRDNALDRCSPGEIVNAYDNAIAYSDHVISQAILTLQAQRNEVDSALLFVSDHGESLGEKGLFLHGMPYEFAPEQQKEIPFLAWLPARTIQRLELDRDCLAQRKDSLSHDHLYHSMLGLTGTRATTYRPDLDVFGPCRRATKLGLEALRR